MAKPNYRIEVRIVCELCSGARNTFQHSPDGLTLYTLHLAAVHGVNLSASSKARIQNAKVGDTADV